MPVVEIRKLKDGFFSDPKTGWSAYPFVHGLGGGADIRAVHVVAIYQGQVRGNHYHAHTNEVLLMFSGRGTFYWEEEGALREHQIEGAPTVIKIPAGVKHAFRNTGESTVYLIAVRDGEHDANNPDIVRAELVK